MSKQLIRRAGAGERLEPSLPLCVGVDTNKERTTLRAF